LVKEDAANIINSFLFVSFCKEQLDVAKQMISKEYRMNFFLNKIASFILSF